MKFLQMFAGKRWRGDVVGEWGCWKRQFSLLSQLLLSLWNSYTRYTEGLHRRKCYKDL